MIKIIEINSLTGNRDTLEVSAYFRSNDVGSPHFISVSKPYNVGEPYRHVLIRDGEQFDIEITFEGGDSLNPYSFVATESVKLAAVPLQQFGNRPAPRLAFAG